MNILRKIDLAWWCAMAKLKFRLRRHVWPEGLQVKGPLGLGGSGRMDLGRNITIVSLSRYNRAGINHPTELSVETGGLLRIGDGVGMSGAAIYCARQIEIGSHVLIGANSRIYDTDFHALDPVLRRQGDTGGKGAVRIGDDVWLGANVTVLKGVTIGDRSVIAAGSLVTRDIPADCIAAGTPAEVIRRLKEPSVVTADS